MFADTFIARVLNQHRLTSLWKAHKHFGERFDPPA
jgi:hypothetical protein